MEGDGEGAGVFQEVGPGKADDGHARRDDLVLLIINYFENIAIIVFRILCDFLKKSRRKLERGCGFGGMGCSPLVELRETDAGGGDAG